MSRNRSRWSTNLIALAVLAFVLWLIIMGEIELARLLEVIKG